MATMAMILRFELLFSISVIGVQIAFGLFLVYINARNLKFLYHWALIVSKKVLRTKKLVVPLHPDEHDPEPTRLPSRHCIALAP